MILDLESYLQRCQQLPVTGRKHFDLKVNFIFTEEQKYFWDISSKVEIIYSTYYRKSYSKSISLWMLLWFYSIFKGIEHIYVVYFHLFFSTLNFCTLKYTMLPRPAVIYLKDCSNLLIKLRLQLGRKEKLRTKGKCIPAMAIFYISKIMVFNRYVQPFLCVLLFCSINRSSGFE